MYGLVDANSFYASCERVFRPDLCRKPVIVLSNNDGCVVARSKEAKEIGIKMGDPYFQITALIRRESVAVFSSNYTLYDNMSRRVQDILRPLCEEMEVYSIDESFLSWSHQMPWRSLGEQIMAVVKKCTGLPVAVGFGPTKTLSKLANHLAKRGEGATGVHVLDCEEAILDALGCTQLIDIWGISTGFLKRLLKLRIKTPLELRNANPFAVRKTMGVVGQRIVYELRGESCIPLEHESPNKQNICCSRSFGTVTSDPVMMREAVATFASQAAVKLRKQDLIAERLAVFVQTDRHAAVEQYAASWAMRFPPSNDSRELSRYAATCLQKVFRPQHAYKKAGILLMELSARELAQPVLFEDRDLEGTNRLMMLMDSINRDHGRGAIRLASESPRNLKAGRTWHMRADKRSPRYTTRWEEIPTATPR